jgi:hypothetical protein
MGLVICFGLLHIAQPCLGSIKKPPLVGAAGRPSWKTSFEGRDQWLKDLSLGVLHTGELGLAQPFGLEDLLADQG